MREARYELRGLVLGGWLYLYEQAISQLDEALSLPGSPHEGLKTLTFLPK